MVRFLWAIAAQLNIMLAHFRKKSTIGSIDNTFQSTFLGGFIPLEQLVSSLELK